MVHQPQNGSAAARQREHVTYSSQSFTGNRYTCQYNSYDITRSKINLLLVSIISDSNSNNTQTSLY